MSLTAASALVWEEKSYMEQDCSIGVSKQERMLLFVFAVQLHIEMLWLS